SYFGQIMVTTTSHIGNYGIKENESQSEKIYISGLICKNFSYVNSRVASKSVDSWFNKQKLIAISDVDTRALVRYIRENGAMNAVISTEINNLNELKRKLINSPEMDGLELASRVSTKKSYLLGNPKSKYRLAVLDLGVKNNILTNFINRGFYIKVFPYDTDFDELVKFKPNGFFLSNGPGDPKPLSKVIETTKEIINNNFPLFGICLGHQIIALANGINTYKMFNGHRGINHPVLNLKTTKGEITSQNHGFAVDFKEAKKNKNVLVTHQHLNDNTVAGIELKNKKCFSVQYHPEAGPGPNDGNYLFDQFLSYVKLN
ncbi:MAG: glutamine-hydrolyzing carbamoyl-phosphate synthase small subunit, partial [Pelagibacterales bacterium]|nr:glutamine-hydrolyzing carbamoyl-phosphate synthase small subunit [Pelagibacterales bacterium]